MDAMRWFILLLLLMIAADIVMFENCGTDSECEGIQVQEED